jgi:hypothetical protein
VQRQAAAPPGTGFGLRAALMWLANNLNQLTKLAHQGRMSLPLLPCLAAIMAEVRKIRRHLMGWTRPVTRRLARPVAREAMKLPRLA